MKVVSLLPSATEIVCALGLQDQLVGISHSCDYPVEITGRTVITRTSVPKDASSQEIDEFVRGYLGDHAALYQLNLDALEATAPDVIVSQRLCDVCAVSSDDVEAAFSSLSNRPNLVDLEPEILADVFADIKRVGEALGVASRADDVIGALQNRVDTVAQRTASIPVENRPRVALLEWLLPPFNSGHWNPELVELAGGIDCLGPAGKPSRTVSWQDVLQAQPDVLVIGCCGFSRQRAIEDFEQLVEIPEWQLLMKRVGGKVLVTDGNAYFSRPGPRLVDGLEALAHALHPGVHTESETDAQVDIIPVIFGSRPID